MSNLDLDFIEITKENKTKSGIYGISNVINNKLYIGSAKNFYNRFSVHLTSLKKKNHHNKYL